MEMNDLVRHLRQYSEMLRELHSQNGRELPKFVSVEEFTLAHGRPFGENHDLPVDINRGPKKECFTNATTEFLRNGGAYAYVEGIAAGKDIAFPTHHAWLVNQQGKVFDPTWDYPAGGALYYGIAFSDDYLFETTSREGYYGLLAPGSMYNRPLFSGKDEPKDFYHPWFLDKLEHMQC